MSSIGGGASFQNGRRLSWRRIDKLRNHLRGKHQTNEFICDEKTAFLAVYLNGSLNGQAALDRPFMYTSGFAAIDGRIDNRGYLLQYLNNDIRELLHASGHTVPSGPVPNSVVIYAAFLRWKNELINNLQGDFFFSIFDLNSNQLVLGRDCAGVRPGYFEYRPGESVWWASELSALAEESCVPTAIDREFVADYLVITESWGHTPYPSIRKVEPGECICLSEDRVTRAEATVLPREQIRLRSDQEYEEQFTELLAESIRRRCASGPVVTCELSGGLDSSAIVCLAHNATLQADSRDKIQTVSYVYDRSLTSDETKHVGAIDAQTGMRTHFIEDHNLLSAATTYGSYPNPQQLFHNTFTQVIAHMESTGSQVLLSGHGGDQATFSIGPTLSIFPSYVKEVGLGQTLKLFHSHSRASGRPFFQMLWRSIAVRALPAQFQAVLDTDYMRVPQWIHEDLRDDFDLDRRRVRQPKAEAIGDALQQQRYNFILNAISISSSNYYHERGIKEVAFPFLDRELLSFLLAIPISQLVRPGEFRSIMRRGLAKILPEETCRRTTKQGPDEAITLAIQREWNRLQPLKRRSCLAELQLVEPAKFALELERARFGLSENRPFLLRALSLEFWLQKWLRT